MTNPTPEEFQAAVETPMHWEFSGYRGEYTCTHGVGHGFHSHGCDGCCSRKDFPGNRYSPLIHRVMAAVYKYPELQQELENWVLDYCASTAKTQAVLEKGPETFTRAMLNLIGIDQVERDLNRLLQIAEENASEKGL